MSKFAGLMRSTRAATAVEYGLIVAMIFIAALAAMSAVGASTMTMWDDIGEHVDGVM
ncbi:MAG: Flp family type IVb pilin [Sphingopyxis sp.]|uniref:Flp family type IVb pilin n=1 Tax=Sphingopyxis sp. TaxID=1908224 RepID=UPI003D811988